eukprot:1900940-Amphidinium_carterae.3
MQNVKLTPAKRTLRNGSTYQRYNMAPALGLAEAHIKSELLTGKVLPEEFVEHAALGGCSGADRSTPQGC